MKRSAWLTLLAVVVVAVAAPYSMPPPGHEVPALVQQAPFTSQHGPTMKAFEPGRTPLQNLVDGKLTPDDVRPDGLTAKIMVFALASIG